jgi:Tfp pilus assembly protein PilF
MLSLRSTDGRHIVAGLGVSIVLLSACASVPPPPEHDAGVIDVAGSPVETPAEVLSHYEQVVGSMAAGDTGNAELRFQEFLQQNPGYPGAHVNLAIIYADRGDLEAAENSLADALDIDPDYASALNQLGVVLRRQGKFAEAETAYLKALAGSPDFALTHYNLGVLNDLYLQRLATALVHYQRYLSLVGEDELVAKWIVDIERRIGSRQQTARMME